MSSTRNNRRESHTQKHNHKHQMGMQDNELNEGGGSECKPDNVRQSIYREYDALWFEVSE